MQIIEVSHQFRGTPTPRSRTDFIIIHHTGGPDNAPGPRDMSAQQIHTLHLQKPGWLGIGYNYIIRPNGVIERGRPDNAAGAHTENFNSVSIGICVCGDFRYYPPAPQQLNSLEWLIRDIWRRYGRQIPVVGHRDRQATECPGPQFPLADLQRRLQQASAAPQPTAVPASPRVVINGLAVKVPLTLIDGRLYLELRGFADELKRVTGRQNLTLRWDGPTQTAYFENV